MADSIADNEVVVITTYVPDSADGTRSSTQNAVRRVIWRQSDTQAGITTVTLVRGDLVMVVKAVPAQVCPNCGEECVDEQVPARLIETAEEMARVDALVDVREFRAA